MFFKKYLYFFLALIFLFLFPNSVNAAGNFTTEYNVIYTATETGLTHAKLQGVLTNTSSQYYAASYKMQVGFDEITNVKASDADGTITPQVTKNENGYVIALTFNTKSVGMNSKLPFTITFETPTITRKFGKILGKFWGNFEEILGKFGKIWGNWGNLGKFSY